MIDHPEETPSAALASIRELIENFLEKEKEK